MPEPITQSEPAAFARRPEYPETPLKPRRARPEIPLGDLVGGRWLAWIGGVAMLLGIVLLLALAVSRGWIDPTARVTMAAVASAALIGAGALLHARRGRTEAAVAMTGAGTAAMFATLLMARQAYDLIPAWMALAGSVATGAVATTLAIRWAGRALGTLGLLGALIVPLLIGATDTGTTVAVLGVAAAGAVAVAAWQRWWWMGVAAVGLALPQWGAWVLAGHAPAIELLALSDFGALGLLGALGLGRAAARGEDPPRTVRGGAIVLGVLGAVSTALLGHFALVDSAGSTVAALWMGAFGVVHVAAGLVRVRRWRIPGELELILLALGVALIDAAFALSTHGVVLVGEWGATAVGLAWVRRRRAGEGDARITLEVGAGAHIGLAVLRAVLAAPQDQVGVGHPGLTELGTVVILALASVLCARLQGEDRRPLQGALDALGLLAVGYLTAGALAGPSLVVAWALEGVALAELSRRTGQRRVAIGAGVFLGAAVVHVLVIEAPPSSLLLGAPSLGAAAIGLGALAIALARMSRTAPSILRGPMLGAVAATVLYLASVAIVTVFQPDAGSVSDVLLALSVRQQGQVLLSALWTLAGLGGLIVGLRRDLAPVRNASLGLLLVSVAKVFTYDLSTLDSIYRVSSFIVLGLLLLAAAFAYQRLRPPPVPDMRTLHRSQH
jgi:uncharacterized membrane protein